MWLKEIRKVIKTDAESIEIYRECKKIALKTNPAEINILIFLMFR